MPESNRGRRFEVVTVCFVVIVSILLLAFVFSLGRQNGEAIGEYVANSDTYARQAEEQIKECLAFTDDASESVCIREVVEATNENERAESDLVAQTEMSLWALCMLIATIIMTLITAAGVWFVKGTLEQSVAATAAAHQAIDVTRDIGQAQVRAYLTIEDCYITPHPSQNDIHWDLSYTVRNCGQSPARRLATSVRMSGVIQSSGLIIPDLAAGGEHKETGLIITNASRDFFMLNSHTKVKVDISILVGFEDVFQLNSSKSFEPADFYGIFDLIGGVEVKLKPSGRVMGDVFMGNVPKPEK